MWYAVQVWKNEERSVSKLIAPIVQEVKKMTKIALVQTRRGERYQSVSMLPGYILVKVQDLDPDLHAKIRSLPCVVGVLTDRQLKPVRINDTAVLEFEKRLMTSKHEKEFSIGDLIIEVEDHVEHISHSLVKIG